MSEPVPHTHGDEEHSHGGGGHKHVHQGAIDVTYAPIKAAKPPKQAKGG